MISAELREFAEAADRFTLLPSDVHRFTDERFSLVYGREWANVCDVRVGGDDVAGLVAEVRERLPHGLRITWWIGPSSEPPDLHAQLERLGLGVPSDGVTDAHAIACTTEPPNGPPGVEVRRVETFEDSLVAVETAWDAFETPEDRRAERRPHLREEFDAAVQAGVPVTFLAFVEGRPAGSARSVYSPRGVFLIAGAVLPWARRRGVYRSLVRARWDDAVERGTPALVTEAKADTSYPILIGLGFEEVCVIRRLEDPPR